MTFSVTEGTINWSSISNLFFKIKIKSREVSALINTNFENYQWSFSAFGFVYFNTFLNYIIYLHKKLLHYLGIVF